MKSKHAGALALVLTLVGWVALDIMMGREKNSLLGLVAVIAFPLVFLIRLIVQLTAKKEPKNSGQIRPT
jgi:hypothetical protein